MRKTHSLILALLTTLVLGAVAAALTGDVAVDLHPHVAECQSCHLAGTNVTSENAHQLVSSQEALCGRCHQNALEVSHPTGFTPMRDIPAEYPLDWKGDVTCSTCHETHAETPGLLRGIKTGKELCLSCHTQEFFASMPDAGTSIESLGHLDARTDPATVALDPYSLQCMNCHAGEGDGAPVVGIDGRGILRHSNNSINHPIGNDYRKSERFGGYRPMAMLSQTILLPQGRIGCVSCHVGYSQKHGALVMPNMGSSLCLECHDL